MNATTEPPRSPTFPGRDLLGGLVTAFQFLTIVPPMIRWPIRRLCPGRL